MLKYVTTALVALLSIAVISYNISVVVEKRTVAQNILAAPVVLEGPLVGSGILLSPKYVLTALHVVDAIPGDNQFVVFNNAPGELIKAKVIVRDPTLDLAILELEKPSNIAPVIFNCITPAVGDRIYAIGAPHGYEWMVRWGRVASTELVSTRYTLGIPRTDGVPEPMRLYTADLNAMRGNSGGGVFDFNGYVAGLVTMVYYDGEANNYLQITIPVKPEVVCKFLNDNEIEYRQPMQSIFGVFGWIGNEVNRITNNL